jgi:hypothetical protein
MVVGVIVEVASLAHAAEVSGVTISGVVVEVGDGEDNPASGDGVGLTVFRLAVRVGWTAFAAVAGSFVADFVADFFPVGGIARQVFDWHRMGSLSVTIFLVMSFPIQTA